MSGSRAQTSSQMWRFFDRPSYDRVKCKLCGRVLCYNQNTSAGWNHLKIHGITRENAAAQTTPAPIAQRTPIRTAVPSPQQGTPRGTRTEESQRRVVRRLGPSPPTAVSVPPSSASVDSVESSPSSSSLSQATSSTSKTSFSVQGSLLASFQKIAALKEGASVWEAVTDAILYFISRDCLPMNVVEGLGFRQLFHVALPHYKVPSRKTITRRLEAKYAIRQGTFANWFSEQSAVNLTTDIWTETMTTRSYLGFTAHVLENRKLKTVLIGVTPLHSNHTSLYLQTSMRSVLEEWKIKKESIVRVVSDGGANIKKACKDEFGPERHLTCAAHGLQLVPNTAISATPGLRTKPVQQHQQRPGSSQSQMLLGTASTGLIDKVKAIVTFTKRSVNAADELRRLQRLQEGTSEGNLLKLKQEVETRWNSTFEMIVRFINLSPLVSQVLVKFPDGPAMLTARELATLRGVKALLSPLEFVTRQFCAEKYVTISKVLPLIYLMKTRLSNVEDEGDDIVKTLKKELQKQIEEKFGTLEHSRNYTVATLLDPRFKSSYFEHSPLVKSNAYRWAITAVKEEILRQGQAEKRVSEQEVLTAVQPADPKDTDDLWELHKEVVSSGSAREEDEAGGMPIELRQYLNRPTHKDLNADVFELWGQMRDQYPHVHNVAMTFLSVPATSVPSERLFSKTGQIITERRNRLSGKHLQMLLFLGSLCPEEW